MPSQHARLSPSAAERWLACPASVRMVAEVPPSGDSVYAREGTLAHEVAELEARCALGLASASRTETDVAAWRARHAGELTTEQMDAICAHAQGWARLLVERRDAMGANTQAFLEVRVKPGVPHCFGTGDAVLVAPTAVEIWDFKYGMGVQVMAEDNPQLGLYGLGALEGFGDVVDTTETVVCGIYQPRISADPNVVVHTADDLRTWRATTVLPAVELALTPDAPFNPGESQCRWCPAAGTCRARAEASLAEDFTSDPDVLSDEELARVLDQLPQIKDWVKAVEHVSLEKLYRQGHTLPGYKTVLSGGRRRITDETAAVELLVAAGYARDRVQRVQAQTLGALEKVVGTAKLPALLGDLLQKSDGTPSVVPESDTRPHVTHASQAASDFEEQA